MNEKKCMYCMRYMKSEIYHLANVLCCVVLQNEIERILNLSDHGY